MMPNKMPPVAQMLVLYHLEKSTIDGLNTSGIAELVGLAYPTINVALRWLETNNIIYCCPLKVSEQRDIHPQCCCNGIADDFSEGKPLS